MRDVISFTHGRHLWTTSHSLVPPARSDRQPGTRPGLPRAKPKDRQPQHRSNSPAMRSVAVLRYGNRLGPHPMRSCTRPVRSAGLATGGTGELPGTFAPQCHLVVQLSTQTNGRHERMHLTLKKETTKPAAANFLQQQARFDDFIEVFNQERPHEALDMKCPAEVYRPSTRVYQGLPDIDYPFHDKVIVVTNCGRICLGSKKINFSTVFAGQAVGIKEVHDDIWLVSFMDYDLGYFDLDTRVLEPLDNPFGPRLLPM